MKSRYRPIKVRWGDGQVSYGIEFQQPDGVWEEIQLNYPSETEVYKALAKCRAGEYTTEVLEETE